MGLTDGIPRHPPGESWGNTGAPGVNFPIRIILNCSAFSCGADAAPSLCLVSLLGTSRPHAHASPLAEEPVPPVLAPSLSFLLLFWLLVLSL